MHKSSTFEYSCNSFLFFLRVREEKKKKNYVIFTCSKCLRPSSSSGSVETLPIPGAPTTGVSTGRRAGLGLGTGGGRMRRGEAVSEGICDRGCWTSGTISTEKKKKKTDENPSKYGDSNEEKLCHQVGQLAKQAQQKCELCHEHCSYFLWSSVVFPPTIQKYLLRMTTYRIRRYPEGPLQC